METHKKGKKGVRKVGIAPKSDGTVMIMLYGTLSQSVPTPNPTNR